jgi:hypothetical protein
MLGVEKFTVLKPEMGHTFYLNYSNEDENITKDYEPKLQVQYMEKLCVLGIAFANSGVNKYWMDDYY